MKRGSSVKYFFDSNRAKGKNESTDRYPRRPSKIEERIRIRRLHNSNNYHHNCNKNDSTDVKFDNHNVKAVRKNSRESSCSPKTSNSCSSSSSEYLAKVCLRGSKECVDLLEIGSCDLSPSILRPNVITRKPRARAKSGVIKICRGIRPRSAPCSPLFRMKCFKHNSTCNGRQEPANDFIDCKIVERDCIDQERNFKDETQDFESINKPLGNPALISLMKESLDKIQAAEMRMSKSCEEIVGLEPNSDFHSADNYDVEIKARETIEDKTREERLIESSLEIHSGDDLESQKLEKKEEEEEEEEKEDASSKMTSHIAEYRSCEIVENPCENVSVVVEQHPEKIYSNLRENCVCRKSEPNSESHRSPESCSSFNLTADQRFLKKNGACNSAKKSEPTFIKSCGCCCCCCCQWDGSLRSGICRNKIQDRRSCSSPRRRVTFRLPSLVIPEEDEEKEEEDKMKNRTNNSSAKIFGCNNSLNKDKKKDEEDTRKFDGVIAPIISSCCYNNHRAKFRRRCNYCRDKYLRTHQHRSRSPKTVDFCKNNTVTRQHNDGIVVENLHSSDSKTSLTSAKDWAIDADENVDFLIRNNVSFPKETRQAMNVLLQCKTNRANKEVNPSMGIPGQKLKQKQQQQQQQQQSFREANLLKKPDLEIFDIEGKNEAMHVATYAQALAVFQRTCDPLAGTSCKKKRHILWKENDGEIIGKSKEYLNRNRKGNVELFDTSIENLTERSTPNDTRNGDQYLNFLCNLRNPESDLRTFPGSGRPKGLNMQTNGSDNGNSENGIDRTGWTVGLINGRFKYLTAETFGFKINANGASLKKKQLWTLEGSEHQVFLRSHLDRYLAVDQFGNVTCEAEDTADPGCAFQIQVASDGSGRWALKNIQRGYFLGSSQDELKCTAKVPGDAEYWLVHLAARPQVNLRSAGRKRFAHLSAAQDEIHVDAPVPWGEDTLFTLEFRPSAMPDPVEGNGDARREVRSEAGIGGHYALHTCNNKYLARDGKLLDSCTRDCLYAAEFHAGMLALRDVSGAYLAPIGSKAVLKSRSNTVTRDELFSLEDSLPQASFVAALNQRYVSVKQGVDVTANQDEISGHETFQLEFDRATKRWYLRTMQDRYWTLEAGGGIQASDHKRSSNALFDLIWQPADGTVALRANNGKFLATKRSGHLYANADTPGESEASKFYFYLMNRPVLVLRCEQGFVGLKSNASPKLECNKASYETIRVERCDRGIVRFKGQNGKYWHADSEGVTSDADVPSDGFYLELREPSRICIKSTDGRYLSAGKNGVFRLGDTDYESATKWEF